MLSGIFYGYSVNNTDVYRGLIDRDVTNLVVGSDGMLAAAGLRDTLCFKWKPRVQLHNSAAVDILNIFHLSMSMSGNSTTKSKDLMD